MRSDSIQRRSSRPFLRSAFGLLFLSIGLAAQNTLLNGPLARPAGGDVRAFELDADGSRVVYLADQEQDGVFELFTVKPGAGPVHLTPALAPDTDVQDFQLAGGRVAYRVTSPQTELFSVPVDGGPSVRLNPPLVDRGNVSSYRVSPDGRFAVFIADALVDDRYDLFAARMDGSAPAVRLNTGDDRVLGFQITPDSRRVVFQDLRTGVGSGLWTVSVAGGAPSPLASGISSTNLSLQITSDANRALFLADDELFSAPVDGRGAPVQLDAPGSVSSYRLTPDGKRAVLSRFNNGRNRYELYSIPVSGALPAVALNASMPQGAGEYAIDAEGAHVLYRNEDARLASVPVVGGASPVVLSGTGTLGRFQPVPGGRVAFLEELDHLPGNPNSIALFSAHTDGSGAPLPLATALVSGSTGDFEATRERVLYRSQTLPPYHELFSVPIDGHAPPVRLHAPLLPEREVLDTVRVSADGKKVAFSADVSADDVFELFLAPADGSTAPVRLNPTFLPGRIEGNVASARFSADGRFVVYRADQDEDEAFELYRVSALGGANLKLNAPLTPAGDVLSYALTPTQVVYLADQDVNGVNELYSVALAGGTAVRLNAPVTTSVSRFRLTADGARVVYQADEDGDLAFELCSAPTDGSAPSVRLGPGLSTFSSSAIPVALSPLSDRLVYAGDPEHDGVESLFEVPLAGGATVHLADGFAGGILDRPEITADGARALYLTRDFVSGARILRSVPTLGGASPIDLSPPAGYVSDFRLTPDGTSVVFSGNGGLFRVPVDGSAAAVSLQTPSAQFFELAPDGTRVVFLVPGGPGFYSLHSVASDGSSPPVQLSPAQRYDTLTLRHFAIDSTSRRVVFRSGQTYASRLFSVAIDGSAPAIELSRTETYEMVDADFALTADGRTVVYRQDDSGFRTQLFRTAIDGGSEPVRINRPPHGFSVDVFAFELAPDGKQLVHITRQSTRGVAELYQCFLTRGVRASDPPR